MNAAVGLTAGLGLDGDRCIRVIPDNSHPKHFENETSNLVINKFTLKADISRSRTTNLPKLKKMADISAVRILQRSVFD